MTRIADPLVAFSIFALLSIPALAGEPLLGRLAPDPLETNGGDLTLLEISDPDCVVAEDCPTATGDFTLAPTSFLDVSFDRNTTELTVLGGALVLPDFGLPLSDSFIVFNFEDTSIVTDPAAIPPFTTIGGNSGDFTIALEGLINAVIRINQTEQALPFEDVSGDVTVSGTFTFDPVQGRFTITEAAGSIGPQVVEVPLEMFDFLLEISGSFDLNFVVAGVLDVFLDGDFESGDTSNWSSVIGDV